MFKNAKVVMLTTKNESKYPYLIKSEYLYIITNDKIEIGDWYLDFRIATNPVVSNTPMHQLKIDSCKKIIATTDENLSLLHLIPTDFINYYYSQCNNSNKIIDILVEYIDNGIEFIDNEEDLWIENSEVYINEDNKIIIKNIKDTFTKEEVTKLLKSAITECYSYPERFSTEICTDSYKINAWIETQLN